MANQTGFRFEIKGEVFIAQKSNDLADITAAGKAAEKAKADMIKVLAEIPVVFTITGPTQVTRREAKGEGDPPASTA